MRAAATALVLATFTAIPASAFDPAAEPPYRVEPYAAPGARPVQAATSNKIQARIEPGLPLAFVMPQAIVQPAVPGPAGHDYAWDAALDARIAAHAAANGVPVELARRVVRRESNGNARAVSKGNYGLMQIRLGTAKAMGYRGTAQGLLDAETNMTYAMKYLSGAYRAAGGNHDRAVALYARGYYPEAKKMGFSPYEPPRAATLATATVAR